MNDFDRVDGWDKISNPVPGVGPIIGCRIYKGTVIAMRRDNSGDHCIWMAVGEEWQQVKPQ